MELTHNLVVYTATPTRYRHTNMNLSQNGLPTHLFKYLAEKVLKIKQFSAIPRFLLCQNKRARFLCRLSPGGE